MRHIDIRTKLRELLVRRFAIDDPLCRVQDELGLCQGSARIDIAVINGHLHGYEIKSEEDTLRRLPGQLDVYLKVFDYLTFVTNEKHLPHIATVVPEWSGLMVASYTTSGAVKIRSARDPRINRLTDPKSVVQLLWRDEAFEILRTIGKEKGLASKPRRFIWDALATSISPKDLRVQVRTKLKMRVWNQKTSDQLQQRGDAISQPVAMSWRSPAP